MEVVKVLHDQKKIINIENKSINCPFCGKIMIPSYLYASQQSRRDSVEILTKCTSSDCEKVFICLFQSEDNHTFFFYTDILPTALPLKKTFSSIIDTLSTNFIDIYNQAYAAEQLGLNQICGVGYRKALEFIIKDYLIFIKPEGEHDTIKNKFLNNCIREDVEDLKIKTVAARAVWLGNDETHYIRKWNDKDVHDLKAIINLVIHWIESEIETKKLLEEMPEFKS